jgi:hypothetical protein
VVWVVTLNGRVCGASATADGASRIMDAIKALPKYAHETWRAVGECGWSSPKVTSLRRVQVELEVLA